MKTLKTILIMCFAMFLVIGFFSCEDTSRARDILFQIDNLEENILEIESETYVQIRYSTNAPSGYSISFAVDPSDSGLTLNGTGAAENKMTAYAAKAAEGDFFNVTATISSNSETIDVDFIISVNVDGFRITMNGTQGTRFDIDYTKPWPITYTINPSSLQELVTVTYSFVGTPPNNNLVVNNSNAAEDPNTVRVTENPSANVTYNLRAAATYDGVTINTPFTVRAMPFEALNSITASNINISAGGTAPVSYRVQPGHHQGSAIVTYSDNSDGKLSFEGNSMTAAADAEGTYTVTMTAYLPADPANEVTGTFRVTIREPTKNYSNRSGQTVAEIGSIYHTSATGTGWHVTQIDNLTAIAAEDNGEYLDNYIIGVDLGTLLEIEALGAKFFDVDGYEVGDVMELLSEYGVNYIRLRIWVNPYTTSGGSFTYVPIPNPNNLPPVIFSYGAGAPFGGGTNDLPKVIEMAQRAVKWGWGIKLNFHYADFWCHPGQQPRPRSWPTGTNAAAAAEVGAVLKQYTKDVLAAMNEAECLPDIVQIGNESRTGIAGFSGTGALPQVMYRMGSEAVREASALYGKHMKIMFHSTDLHQGGIRTLFDPIHNAGIDYDILGMSFYPMWHGNRSSFQAALADFTTRYGKEICIAEYSSAYTTRPFPNLEDKSSQNANQRTFTGGNSDLERTFVGQAQLIRNINSDIMNFTKHPDGRRLGIGGFWWEAAWLPTPGHSWANPASSEWYHWQASNGGSSGDSNQPRLINTTWANQGFFTYEGTVIPSINAFLQMLGKPIRNYTRD